MITDESLFKGFSVNFVTDIIFCYFHWFDTFSPVAVRLRSLVKDEMAKYLSIHHLPKN